jgi:hypothetical protein
MSEHVWVSISGENRYRDFDFGLSEEKYTRDERIEMVRALDLGSRKGLPLPADRFPDVLETVGKGSRLPKTLPDYINWLCPVVSERLADVLGEGDLGSSSFYPMKLYRRDKDTTFDQKFLILNIAVCKEVLLPDESSNLTERVYAPSVKMRAFDINTWVEEDDIVLQRAALDGADIWVDPMLPSETFFVSDRLYQILKKAKLAKLLDLKRCRIAD